MSDYTIIRLKNAVFYAHHGVLEPERTNGGKFEIDCELVCNVTEAEKEDNLKKTVNYELVYSFIKDNVQTKKFYLIESLASKIAEALLDNFEMVEKVCIKVRKPSPPLGGVVDSVEVEYTEYRHKDHDI